MFSVSNQMHFDKLCFCRKLFISTNFSNIFSENSHSLEVKFLLCQVLSALPFPSSLFGPSIPLIFFFSKLAHGFSFIAFKQDIDLPIIIIVSDSEGSHNRQHQEGSFEPQQFGLLLSLGSLWSTPGVF